MTASFPETPPSLYQDKTTGNDVGDTMHWDGGDANCLKAELLAVAAKVGIDGDPDPMSQDWRISDLEARAQTTKGGGTLTAGTTTTVTDQTVTQTSVVTVQGTDAGFAGLAVHVSGKAEGSFTLTHGTAAGTETFDYLVVN